MAKENEQEELTLQEQEILAQKEEAEKAKNAPKGYKRVDIEGGVLTDEDEINYFKTIQKREVLNNHMLGDFNSTGDYVLKEPMMKELVIMKKFLIDSYFNNVYFVKSALITREVGNLQFCVMIKTSKDGNKATAILKLLEPVTKAGGYIQNTNSFTVATYTDDNDNYFLSKVKKVFNIYPPEDPDVKQDEEEVAEIMARLAMRSKTKLLGASVYTQIEKDHYNSRIEILRKGGYDDVLEELNNLMKKAKVFLNPEDPNYYRTMNDLVDQAVDNIGRKDPKRLKDIKKALLAANKDYIGKCDEAESIIKGYKEKAEIKEKLQKESEMAAKLAREKEEAEKAAQQAKPQKKPQAKAKKPQAKAKKPQVKKPAKKKEAKKEDLFFLGRGGVDRAAIEQQIREINAQNIAKAQEPLPNKEPIKTTEEKVDATKTANAMLRSVFGPENNKVNNQANQIVNEMTKGNVQQAASNILGGQGTNPVISEQTAGTAGGKNDLAGKLNDFGSSNNATIAKPSHDIDLGRDGR